jgi:ketosteroid isomerase-like protein
MKIPLIVAQQIGALAAKFDEAFNRNDAGGAAAFFTEDAVRVTPQGTSRTSRPQNHLDEISHYGAAFSKARKQLEMARLAVVQNAQGLRRGLHTITNRPDFTSHGLIIN